MSRHIAEAPCQQGTPVWQTWGLTLSPRAWLVDQTPTGERFQPARVIQRAFDADKGNNCT